MNKATWLAWGVAALVACSWRASAQSPYLDGGGHAAARSWITHFSEAASGPGTLTVVDPAAKVIAVYHVGRENGEIKLKSVRNVDWDLRMVDFNSGSPSPNDIRQGFNRQE
ncbi:MAG TPA: hypothetical protein PKC18_16175 [Lacipirellulaceae bacterium]|nr:hypothetical protein [Lacipirellulaceae bacterium]HMP07002.1 hypothetical protein [Lacipirellulaceae bacterium]